MKRPGSCARQGEPLTDLVLQPHFQRLSWDEVYAGWSSTEHQRYWEELDFEVVPYDRSWFDESSQPDEEQIKALQAYLWKTDSRFKSRAPEPS